MSNVENMVLEYLRRINTGQDKILHEMKELKTRMTSLESSVSGIRRDTANDNEKMIHQQINLDELAERIDNIEKRLEIASAS